MITYRLQCSRGHGHDGWFKDSATFERLAKRRALACPQCGDAAISRALMAPAVASKKEAVNPPPAPRRRKQAPAEGTGAAASAASSAAPAAPPAQAAAGPMPDEMRAMLQRMRAEVEKNCDYVGERFAEEARRIHEGEQRERGIYGEASPEEAEALREDGIEVHTIPWLPRADG